MVLVRDRRWLPLTFKETSEVLKDVQSEGEELNFMYQGIQLTRQFRALKLWMSFKVFGLDAISRAIDAGFENSELAERLLREAGCWEIVTPAQMAIVTFRYIPAMAMTRWQTALRMNWWAACLTMDTLLPRAHQLRDKTVMRLCTNNPRTTPNDLAKTIQLMTRLAAELELQAQARRRLRPLYADLLTMPTPA